MSDCCSGDTCSVTGPKKHRCPVNGHFYPAVESRTIYHHIAKSWRWNNGDKSYYFCDDPACDVAYFASDDSVILKSQLRTDLGVKSCAEDATLCYCFGVERKDYLLEPEIRDYVIEQTRRKLCSCDTSNPSGQCCLKDFPDKNIRD